eukprot:1989681-Pyramimonas_sp.AAC.1
MLGAFVFQRHISCSIAVGTRMCIQSRVRCFLLGLSVYLLQQTLGDQDLVEPFGASVATVPIQVV